MEIAYAFLAHYAEFAADGGLTMVHGDFEVIESPTFPRIVDGVSVAVKLAAEPKEVERDHTVRVEIVGAQAGALEGNPPRAAAADATIPRQAGPFPPEVNSLKVTLIVSFVGIIFPAPKEYPVRITVDGVVSKTIPLRVSVMST
jgi:hypothetical protein